MTFRLALALLVITPAAMAYPWHATAERWILGVAIVVVLVGFAWWRGLFVTTAVARRVAIWRRNRGRTTPPVTDRVTVVLRVDSSDGTPLPVSTIAGYVDRFGLRCDTVRITSRDEAGERRTWVGITVGVLPNLAALQARSANISLSGAADVIGRRLADHLRETGLDATVVDTVDVPLAPGARERWRSVDDVRGSLVACAIPADDRLAERLAAVWAHPSPVTWTSLEFSGTAGEPTLVAVAAIRGEGIEGLVAIAGRQRPVLAALDPRSPARLGVDATPLTAGLLDDVRWEAASATASYRPVR